MNELSWIGVFLLIIAIELIVIIIALIFLHKAILDVSVDSHAIKNLVEYKTTQLN